MTERPKRHKRYFSPAEITTRFKPGMTGNPKGRPKDAKGFATTLQDELKRPVTVTEDGRRKKITKREAVAKQLVNKAAAGDPKAIPILLNATRPYETDIAAGSIQSETMSEEDRLVMENIIKRILECNAAAQSTTVPEPTTKSSSDPNDKDNAP
jgi:Family of unknown function (DUF5681)